SFYIRGEYQHSPFASGYSDAARQAIAAADGNPLLPYQPFAEKNLVTLLDSYVGFTWANNQFTVGKQSLWWGPGRSTSLLLSDNAEPIFMVRFNRVSPIKMPSFLNRIFGPVYSDMFFGRLDGHSFPPKPFAYGQKISFKPTPNLEFGFSRFAVFAGEGVTPLTFHTFFHSIFSFGSQDKGTRNDPGDRRATADFAWRLPKLRDWATLYAEGLVDDDPSPLAAPRRAAWNPGLYLSHLPKLNKMDLRLEAVYTNVPVSPSVGGKFIYWEIIYHDSHTNDGNLLGSWIGREGNGYTAASTYWFSPRTSLQFDYRNMQVASDFIAGGVTLHDGSVKANVRLKNEWSLYTVLQYEHVNAPVLALNHKSNLTTSVQLTFEPKWGRH
ncbi:MAG: capsule assembly Wzi family protein, partial [Limisphaerales bacterium]